MKRIFLSVVMTLTLTTFTFAQRGGRGGPPAGAPPAGLEMQRPDPLAALKAALNLTDAQLDAVKALMQTRQQRVEAIFEEIQQKHQALNELLNAASPNATQVGNAAISLHESEKKLAAERDWFIAELKKLLTGEQQATLDRLIAAGGMPFLAFGPGVRRGPGPPRQ